MREFVRTAQAQPNRGLEAHITHTHPVIPATHAATTGLDKLLKLRVPGTYQVGSRESKCPIDGCVLVQLQALQRQAEGELLPTDGGV